MRQKKSIVTLQNYDVKKLKFVKSMTVIIMKKSKNYEILSHEKKSKLWEEKSKI